MPGSATSHDSRENELFDIVALRQDVCTPVLIHIKGATVERRPERENSNKNAWELVRRATRHTGASLAA